MNKELEKGKMEVPISNFKTEIGDIKKRRTFWNVLRLIVEVRLLKF